MALSGFNGDVIFWSGIMGAKTYEHIAPQGPWGPGTCKKKKKERKKRKWYVTNFAQFVVSRWHGTKIEAPHTVVRIINRFLTSQWYFSIWVFSSSCVWFYLFCSSPPTRRKQAFHTGCQMSLFRCHKHKWFICYDPVARRLCISCKVVALENLYIVSPSSSQYFRDFLSSYIFSFFFFYNLWHDFLKIFTLSHLAKLGTHIRF